MNYYFVSSTPKYSTKILSDKANKSENSIWGDEKNITHTGKNQHIRQRRTEKQPKDISRKQRGHHLLLQSVVDFGAQLILTEFIQVCFERGFLIL